MGTEGDDVQGSYGEAVGYHQNETYHMLGGNDTVYAGEGNDTVYGDSGNDELYGEKGNDTLIGGSGNDYMEGGAGADAYVFNLGDGTDTIHDHEYNNEVIDKIVFGAGISAEDVVMKRIDKNLMVKYSDTDSFVVQDAYVGHYGITGMKFVESMEFEDGTVWDAEYIASHASIHMGTEGDDVQGSYEEAVGYHQNETFHMHGGNDTVYAGEGNDTICGEEGNDTLYGENGNDTLIGGTGNDYMDGGLGADTYIIGAEDGNDTIYNYDYSADRSNDKISYGEGILVEDLSISRVGNDLVITNDKTEQTTVIADAYRNDNYKLYNLEFSDEDKAVIDYSATSLNITYAVKEEPISEESPVEVSPEDALVAVLQEEIAVSQDNASDVISETDIDRMADLLVQEMAGISTEGTVEEIPAGTAPVTDSDALLWVE